MNPYHACQKDCFDVGMLKKEAILFSQYLGKSNPPKELIERYINANKKLEIDVPSGIDAEILKYIHAHPWSVPFLDAATGILRPETSIRKKIYVMAAVLETSPLFAEDFLPIDSSPIKLLLQLLVYGLLAGTKVFLGLPLLLYLRLRK
jgi:hypothetical protein